MLSSEKFRSTPVASIAQLSMTTKDLQVLDDFTQKPAILQRFHNKSVPV